MFTCCCRGLDVGQYGGPRRFPVLEFGRFKFSQERAYDAEAFLFPGDLGAWGEDAEGGVGGDLLYSLFSRLGGLALGRLGFGEVEAGDLEAVEEQAGAAGVDVVGGDAAEDGRWRTGWRSGLLARAGRRWSGGCGAGAGRRLACGCCGGSSRTLLCGGMGWRSDVRR